MTTTFRADTRAGLYGVLTTYQAAHAVQGVAGYLAHVYDHPPENPRTPCAYVDKPMPENDAFYESIYQRVLSPKVVVLNKLASSDQAADEQDVLVDGLSDAFISAARTMVTGARVLPASVDDGEQTYGNAIYAGFAMTFTAAIQLGRTI